MQTNFLSCSTLVVGVVVFASAATAQSDPRPIPLTRPQLIQCIEVARTQISDFSVSFRFDADTAPANMLAARSHRRVLLHDGKVRVDHEYGQMPEYNGPTAVLHSAYDGTHYSHHTVHARVAVRTSRSSQSTNTKGVGFFDMMMWNPTASGRGNGYDDQDLLSVLRSSHSTLRPNLEDIDGRACIVVDERDAQTGGVAFTAWIDAARGFLPIQQQYIESRTGRPYMEFFTDEAYEAAPGVWFPTVGRKINHLMQGVPEIDRGMVTTLTVDRDAAGRPVIAVNAGIAESEFDIIATLPPGTRVSDTDSARRWIVAGKDFERLGESLDTQIANVRKSDPDLDRRLSSGFTPVSQLSTASSFPSPVVFIIAGAGIATLGFTALWLRRGRVRA